MTENNYCACNGGDANYIIRLNQQGAPGEQGKPGVRGFSPSISIADGGDKSIVTIVNETGISTAELPKASNATISITQGGVLKGTFTTNQAVASTIALDAGADIPTLDTRYLRFNVTNELGNGTILSQTYNTGPIDVPLLYENVTLENGTMVFKNYNGDTAEEATVNNTYMIRIPGTENTDRVRKLEFSFYNQGNGGTLGGYSFTWGGAKSFEIDDNDITYNGVSLVNPAGGLINTATGTDALTILGTATSWTNAINIGKDSSVVANNGVAIGVESKANTNAVGIGRSADAGVRGVAIGAYAKTTQDTAIAIGGWNQNSNRAEATAKGAYQIGIGTNNVARTLNIGWFDDSVTPNTYKNYQLLDGNSGIINNARMVDNYTDGTILKESNVLANLKKYAHSTFDGSQFTVVGSPTVSDDGIITNFNWSNHLRLPNSVATNLESGAWRVDFGGTLNDPSKAFVIMGSSATDNDPALSIGNINSNGNFFLRVKCVDNEAVSTYVNANVLDYNNAPFIGYAQYDGNETYTLAMSQDNGATWQIKTVTHNSTITFGNKVLELFTGANTYTTATADLKKFAIISNGVTIASGNKTGTDTYTIGGNTVTVPYTLTKTGSKVVDSAYRTQVTSVYNEYGFAPYYTLDEINDNFTLPQGEIYGYNSRRYLIDGYRNGIYYYELYSDMTLEQGGSCTSGTAVTFTKPFADTNYVLTVPYSAKTTTGFTPSQTGDWIAKGIGEL